MENNNNNKQVTLNIADMMPVCLGNPHYGGYQQPVCSFICEVIVNGTVKGTFDTDLPLDASLNFIVSEEYGHEEFEAEAKEAFDFDDEYIKNAMCDYIKNSEEWELINNYGEKIIKAFNDMKGELVATKVTCKPVKEFGGH